mmetsp:Transcript_35526/g.60183  ORF Transcript_35526/g.60183 Transcript_35526/m.60183 type:complete len:546 (+) Transcript_35526:80-1717(+)
MDYSILKKDLEKEGKLVPVEEGSASSSKDPYKIVVPDTARLKITQVSGSTAGAGSGDFHVYRATRRREQFRVAGILKQAKEQEDFEEFIKRKEQAHAEQIERTAKKASKRKRRKEARKMWRKKSKGQKHNTFSNDGNFLELFQKQQEMAMITLPEDLRKEIKDVISKTKTPFSAEAAKKKNTRKGARKKQNQSEQVLDDDTIAARAPTFEGDGKDVVLRIGSPDEKIKWMCAVTMEDGKIFGARKFEEGQGGGEGAEGAPPCVRFENVPIGTRLEGYAYSGAHGLWKTSPYEVKIQRQHKLIEASDAEELALRLGSFLEKLAKTSIKERKSFTVAFGKGVAPLLQPLKKCAADSIGQWRVFTAEETFNANGEGLVAAEVRASLEPWGVQANGLHLAAASDPDVAAAYAQTISKNVDGFVDPEFDLVLMCLQDHDDSSSSSSSASRGVCGLGANTEALRNRDVLVTTTTPSAERGSNEGAGATGITVTIPLLDAARNLAIFALGKSQKSRENLKSLFDGPASDDRPLSCLSVKPKITWFALGGGSL